MSYDLQQNKALWTFKKQDDNIIESIKINSPSLSIIIFDQNKIFLYLEKQTGMFKAQFQITYEWLYDPFIMIYDKNGNGYLASNGNDVTNKVTVTFFLRVCLPDQDTFNLYIATVEDFLTNPKQMKFRGIQAYPYIYSDYRSVVNKSNGKYYMHGLVYQENGIFPQGFINEYKVDPSCNYQQPFLESATFSLVELNLDLSKETNFYFELQVLITQQSVGSITRIINTKVQSLFLDISSFKNVFNNKKPCQFQFQGLSQYVETPPSIIEPLKCFTGINCEQFLGIYQLKMPCKNSNSTLVMNFFNKEKNGLWYHEQKTFSQSSIVTLVKMKFNESSQHQQENGIQYEYQNIVTLGSQEDLIISSSFKLMIQVYWPCEIAKVNSSKPQNIYFQ
ncbi:UNKNOWN [Stylonychia lemnae]|uniref:Uncharacterized protein n=1 Tax=Stylonychia lemnae TaxID=5949 RepID=A0A078ANY2_STYLE|nr:UNKNOWN [Stylonychia lemnae]|eukprot:CDW82668.1 UNKNOWN [Stylonychia lemnae]